MRLLSNLLGKKATPAPTNFGAPGVNASTPHDRVIDTTKSASKAKSSDASVKVESAKTEANADAENSIYGGIQLKSASVIKQALPKESTTNAVNPYAAVSLKPILTGTETSTSRKTSEATKPASEDSKAKSANVATNNSQAAIQPAAASATIKTSASPIQAIAKAPVEAAPQVASTAAAPKSSAPVSSLKASAAPAESSKNENSAVEPAYTAQAKDEGDWEVPRQRKRTTSRSEHDFEIVKRDEVRAAMADAAQKEAIVESNESLSNDEHFAKAFSRINA